MSRQARISRARAIAINRVTAVAAVSLVVAGYYWQPATPVHYVLDILVRAYLHFVAAVMAHEAVHGQLGNSSASNSWWGRVALFPTTVPYVTFRKTHLHHHAATNIPGKDPDEFLNTRRAWQIPLRAFALPYHWVLWLWRNGRFTRRDRIEYAASYLLTTAVYGFIAYTAGPGRVLLGLIPATALHSLVLWYCFAIKTHEGYSTGRLESRSHNYYGRLLYWVTFGLSLHRTHHLKRRLAWLQMSEEVRSGTRAQRLRFERHIA